MSPQLPPTLIKTFPMFFAPYPDTPCFNSPTVLPPLTWDVLLGVEQVIIQRVLSPRDALLHIRLAVAAAQQT